MTSHPKTLPEQGSNDDDGGAIARVDADLMITQVTSDDVLLGRGAGMYNHVGNVHFRDAVETRKDEYHSTTNERKREIARQVLSEVLRRGGRFLQLTSDGAHYETVDETRALNKCFHDLRGKKKGESDVSAQVSFSIQVGLICTCIVVYGSGSLFLLFGWRLLHFFSARSNEINRVIQKEFPGR